MAKKDKELSFEEALEKLEQALAALQSDTIGLEEAMAQFEAGTAYYQRCQTLLSEAEQKIRIFDRENRSEEAFVVDIGGDE